MDKINRFPKKVKNGLFGLRIASMRPPLFFILATTTTLLIPACRTHHYPSPPSGQPYLDKSPVMESRRVFSILHSPSTSYSQSPPPTRSEKYAEYEENPFLTVKDAPRSTFSVDVDTASYANVRRMITYKQEVPRDSVRIEEMVNYFDYNYPTPTHDTLPFAIAEEVSSCPWEPDHKLVRIAVQGKEVKSENRPQANLVFLVDVSGSMSADNKLPLLKKSLTMLTNQLNENDRIALVVYAGNSGLVLPSTPVAQSDKIHRALNKLESGGSTAGGEGLQLAYKIAERGYLKGGINRVILATDGDFNVGMTRDGDLTDLIEEKAKSGVELSVLGFGMGNYNDSMLEKLSGKGNGNYAYIDTEKEARKVLVRECSGSLVTIAKDVKLQVEFNPANVQAYRLIGYENRRLEDRDFNDDKKDAGEIGAGHQVTAFYEVVPVGVKFQQPSLNKLRYQETQSTPTTDAATNELLTVSLRYKPPGSNKSIPASYIIHDSNTPFSQASPDFRFASSVAAFGMLLRDSEHAGSANHRDVLAWAQSGKGADPYGYRAEFIDLLKDSRKL